MDPIKASYGVENPIYAIIQLAQTTMRSELGKITLDKTFEERDMLNENIVVGLWLFSCKNGIKPCDMYHDFDLPLFPEINQRSCN